MTESGRLEFGSRLQEMTAVPSLHQGPPLVTTKHRNQLRSASRNLKPNTRSNRQPRSVATGLKCATVNCDWSRLQTEVWSNKTLQEDFFFYQKKTKLQKSVSRYAPPLSP